jgi:hypothetical protein
MITTTTTRLGERAGRSGGNAPMSQPEPSVLSGLPQFDWNSALSVRYEVAHEAISQATAAYTVLIRRATTAGDTAEAGRLSALRAACSRARDELDATDAAAVDQAVRHYRQLTEDLRAQAR